MIIIVIDNLIGVNIKQCIIDIKFTKDKMKNIFEITNGLNSNNIQIKKELNNIKTNIN